MPYHSSLFIRISGAFPPKLPARKINFKLSCICSRLTQDANTAVYRPRSPLRLLATQSSAFGASLGAPRLESKAGITSAPELLCKGLSSLPRSRSSPDSPPPLREASILRIHAGLGYRASSKRAISACAQPASNDHGFFPKQVRICSASRVVRCA